MVSVCLSVQTKKMQRNTYVATLKASRVPSKQRFEKQNGLAAFPNLRPLIRYFELLTVRGIRRVFAPCVVGTEY
jgi:hypothetical protein